MTIAVVMMRAVAEWEEAAEVAWVADVGTSVKVAVRAVVRLVVRVVVEGRVAAFHSPNDSKRR